MLQLEEVRGVPLFSTLPAGELERLACTAEDLHLAAGEFAVHEGGERALYAVLAGKIEVVKSINGVLRTLGWRLPGTIFGEVPLAFGTPFPGAYRAAEPSRVMRVEARHYYMIAANSPEVAVKMGALARERIGGLQGIIAAASPRARVTLFAPRWESSSGELRRFLARNRITYDWVTPDTPEWPADLPRDAECPMLRLEDGSTV